VSVGDSLGRKLSVSAYTAFSECGPSDRFVLLSKATPLLSGTLPSKLNHRKLNTAARRATSTTHYGLKGEWLTVPRFVLSDTDACRRVPLGLAAAKDNVAANHKGDRTVN